ncbi:MAG: hypothetical protein EP301_09730 [Gammaproteobacteria bacterium]|nr:MAG: hypothetical protein EP301_09730 [Gammaproteobacteria bacterium]
MMNAHRPFKRLGLIVLVLSLSGCLNIGPNTIVQDRFKYNQAIRDSWEEQMLTNMVAIRYGESPVFLNVSSVIAQYGLETSARVGAGVNNSFIGDDSLQGNASAVWSERPTITYTPVEGQDFAVNLLTPIHPSEVFALIEAGWNAERSLRLLLKTINGITAYDPVTRTQNPDFFEILDAFKDLQDEEALGIRREESGEGTRTFLYLRDVAANSRIERALDVFEEKLRLDRSGEDVEVVFGPYFKDGRTIAMQTMSVMDILTESAAYILVPETHVSEGRTRANRVIREDDVSRPLLRVYSSAKKPADALVSVRSREHFYYIDDRDIDSKKAFSFLMIIMQLTAAQQEDRGPAVTIGTG